MRRTWHSSQLDGAMKTSSDSDSSNDDSTLGSDTGSAPSQGMRKTETAREWPGGSVESGPASAASILAERLHCLVTSWRLCGNQSLQRHHHPRSQHLQCLVTRHISTSATYCSSSILIHICRYTLPASLAEFIEETAVVGRHLNDGKK